MAKRSNEDGFATDDYDMQLENQSGERLRFNSEDDKRQGSNDFLLYPIYKNFFHEDLCCCLHEEHENSNLIIKCFHDFTIFVMFIICRHRLSYFPNVTMSRGTSPLT